MNEVAAAEKSKKSFFYRMLCGVLLGASVIAPGISGSIMAVVMGIYDDLIEIISNPFKNFKKNVFYILPICLGGGLSMIALLQLLRLLFSHFTVPAYMLFITLIAGSIPTVFTEAKAGLAKPVYISGTVLAFAAALTVGVMAKHDIALAVDTSARDLPGVLYYSMSGTIAGITSMIPGMSISMMLMMLNVYETLLKAAAEFDVITIAPVAFCFLGGMILFSRVTRYVFRRWRGLGYLMVLGFMCGSLVSIFPGLPKTPVDAALTLAAIAAGAAVSIALQRLARKFNIREDAGEKIPPEKEK